MMDKRLGYIDSVKGLLIILLIFVHINGVFTNTTILNMPDATAVRLITPLSNFAVSLFMACFFVITGLCSGFKDNFRDFLIKNIKQLIIPTITLSFISLLIKPLYFGKLMPIDFWYKIKELLAGGPWFICALMVSKVLLWCVIKLKGKYTIILISLFCFAFGTTLHLFNFTSNIFWLRHDFLLFPFIALGYLLKGYDYSNLKCTLGLLALYIPSFAVLKYSFDILPNITMGIEIPTWWSAILVFVCSASGSVALIGIFKRFSFEPPWLQYVGRISLTIYLLHLVMLFGLVYVFLPLLTEDIVVAFYAVVAIVSIIILSCSLIDVILSHWPLKWLMGKF